MKVRVFALTVTPLQKAIVIGKSRKNLLSKSGFTFFKEYIRMMKLRMLMNSKMNFESVSTCKISLPRSEKLRFCAEKIFMLKYRVAKEPRRVKIFFRIFGKIIFKIVTTIGINTIKVR